MKRTFLIFLIYILFVVFDNSGTAGAATENLRLLSPNGYETIESGTTSTVSWEAPEGAVSFKLSYSFNNGLKWRRLAKGLTGNSFEWTAPVKRDNLYQCLIRVISYDSKGRVLEWDDSDSNFEIMVLDITSPAEEETFYSGDDVEITWDTFETFRPVKSVVLSYSIDCGEGWKDIETVEGNPGSYIWTIPELKNAPDCSLLKLKLKDEKGKALGNDTIQLTLIPDEII